MELQQRTLVDVYLRTHKRVIIVSLEGVLAKYTSLPELLKPTEGVYGVWCMCGVCVGVVYALRCTVCVECGG